MTVDSNSRCKTGGWGPVVVEYLLCTNKSMGLNLAPNHSDYGGDVTVIVLSASVAVAAARVVVYDEKVFGCAKIKDSNRVPAPRWTLERRSRIALCDGRKERAAGILANVFSLGWRCDNNICLVAANRITYTIL